jgi:hypothetical protein
MLPTVVRAYLDEGYVARLGSPRVLASGVQPVDQPYYIPDGEDQPTTDWGFSVRDVYAFYVIGRELRPRNAFVIGNAYGISAVTLGEMLKPIAVDAIDAEVRDDGALASDVTRRVAKRLGVDLKLTKGFSPQDVGRACRAANYDLVFVDGLHTDEAMLADFNGMKDRLADRCAVYFHDVGLCTMDAAWERVKSIAIPMGFSAHDLTFTDFGSTVLLRGLPELEAMLRTTCYGLRDLNERYPRGYGFVAGQTWEEKPVWFVPRGGRIAFFGAGTDLAPYEGFIRAHPEAVAAIIDDDPKKNGTTKFGVTVLPSAELPRLGVCAVVISTRMYERQVRARLAEVLPDAPTVPERGGRHPVEVQVPKGWSVAPKAPAAARAKRLAPVGAAS